MSQVLILPDTRATKEYQLELQLFPPILTKGRKVVPIDPALEWSESDVEELRYKLLQHSLAALADVKVGAATRLEIEDWIYRENDTTPFSFDACCRSEGCDPVEVRIQVRELLRRLKH